jgi:TRAP-type uncharacterized transport system substrate-binding protein
MPRSLHLHRSKLVAALIETFGFSPLLASVVALFLFVLGGAAVLWVLLSAPPRTITIVTGPPGSMFERYAIGNVTTGAPGYRDELAKHGVTLKILPSDGSLDNLRRLAASDSGIDLALVQGGLVGKNPPAGVVTLGSVAYQPLLIFYRSAQPVTLLSQFAGKRLGIGAKGSGVQQFARTLLKANEITGAPTTFVETDSDEAAGALVKGELDAIFLMGDSAATQTLRTLLHADGIQLFSFTQADAYVRRFPELNKIVMPRGAFDLGQDLPPRDITLVGPTVELIAHKALNSAVSDLFLEVAQTVHGNPGLIAKRGEFPAPLGHEFHLSDDAARFYKSGRGFTYKVVSSFWLASLINRIVVAIVPICLVLIPAIRFFPVMYRWTVQLRIFKCYRPLLQLERSAETPLPPARAKELLGQLDEIEKDVNAMKVPASFASQFYDLRAHVVFVRARLQAAAKG